MHFLICHQSAEGWFNDPRFCYYPDRCCLKFPNLIVFGGRQASNTRLLGIEEGDWEHRQVSNLQRLLLVSRRMLSPRFGLFKYMRALTLLLMLYLMFCSYFFFQETIFTETYLRCPRCSVNFKSSCDIFRWRTKERKLSVKVCRPLSRIPQRWVRTMIFGRSVDYM